MTKLPSESNIYLFFQTRNFSLQNRTALKAFIGKTIHSKKKKIQNLNIIFTTDPQLLKINQDYLGHDYYTDIITFDNSSKSGIDGEIYISIDRVKENALELGKTFKEELHRVIFHGLLHLLGFKDKSAAEKIQMRKKEDEIISRYFG